ncbi:MAG: class I SAM-dependent methyltransferase, partial [Chloroflexota bacterium]
MINRRNTLWGNLVEYGFYLLYNPLAWTYDVVSWTVSLGEWRKWQKESLQFLKGPNVLEIAHGPGHMLLELHGRGWQIVGLDLSAAMGRLAKAKLSRAELFGTIPLIRCKIPELPMAAESFDSILSQFPTKFIFETETLIELHRLLRPGGVVVILPEGHLTREGPIIKFIDWLYYITGQTVGAPNDETADQ